MNLTSTVARAGNGFHAARSYGRLFGNLPEWKPAQRGRDAADQIWELSEQMYAGQVAANNSIPAGYTYLGQLINHDLTFDASSSLEQRNIPATMRNLRTPRFDLDCVYGRGPHDQAYLYDGRGTGRLAVSRNENGEPDLLRSPIPAGNRSALSEHAVNRPRLAIIGDSRNDENIILSQLTLAVISFHNRQIDAGRGFEEARRETRWHYQWIAIHDFLKRLCGSAVVDEALGKAGRPDLRFFDPLQHPYIPVEFSMAAYRVGHAMVRPDYALSADLLDRRQSRLSIFSAIPEDSLEGGRVLPPNWTIQWSCFVEHPQNTGDLQFSKTIGPQISRPLRFLPIPTLDDARGRSLAYRTLLRGWQMGLPSGQDVARRMAQLAIDGNDPLWVYVLNEAAQGGGNRLGPVGARLVAEVFVGLLSADPQSYYSIAPSWTPSGGPGYGLADFLAGAGVPISRNDWDGRLRNAPPPAPPR